jgi:hypothetical protein
VEEPAKKTSVNAEAIEQQSNSTATSTAYIERALELSAQHR